MGADMLMAQVQVPRGLHDRDSEERVPLTFDPVTSEGRDELLRRVDAMDDDALHRVADWTGEDGDDKNRARVREAIDVFFEDRRDVIVSYGQIGTMIESGGMSWGDSPTESFDDIGILEASGICEEPMPWVADAAKVTVTFDVEGPITADRFVGYLVEILEIPQADDDGPFRVTGIDSVTIED